MSILAYIDPGAGSLVIQALIAAALAVPFFFRGAISGAIQRVRPRSPVLPSEENARPSDLTD